MLTSGGGHNTSIMGPLTDIVNSLLLILINYAMHYTDYTLTNMV